MATIIIFLELVIFLESIQVYLHQLEQRCQIDLFVQVRSAILAAGLILLAFISFDSLLHWPKKHETESLVY